MTSQSGGGGNGLPVGGVLSGSLPSPAFATNGTTPLLGTVSAQLGADVVMTTGHQWYDGPTVALTAGRWLITMTLTIVSSSVNWVNARLYDGTTTIISTGAFSETAGGGRSFTLTWEYVATGAVTMHAQASSPAGGFSIRAANPADGVGNVASSLLAMRIA